MRGQRAKAAKDRETLFGWRRLAVNGCTRADGRTFCSPPHPPGTESYRGGTATDNPAGKRNLGGYVLIEQPKGSVRCSVAQFPFSNLVGILWLECVMRPPRCIRH